MRANPLFSVFVVGAFVRIVYWKKLLKNISYDEGGELYSEILLALLGITYRGHSLTPDRGVVLMPCVRSGLLQDTPNDSYQILILMRGRPNRAIDEQCFDVTLFSVQSLCSLVCEAMVVR